MYEALRDSSRKETPPSSSLGVPPQRSRQEFCNGGSLLDPLQTKKEVSTLKKSVDSVDKEKKPDETMILPTNDSILGGGPNKDVDDSAFLTDGGSVLENLIDKKARPKALRSQKTLPQLRRTLVRPNKNLLAAAVYGRDQANFSSNAIVNQKPKDKTWHSLRQL